MTRALLVSFAVVGAALAYSQRSVGSGPFLGGPAVGERVWSPPQSERRCAWVVEQMTARDVGTPSYADLYEKYTTVAADSNTFYRGTAHLFWWDFVRGGWGNYDLKVPK